MKDPAPMVFGVDDDDSVRNSLERLIRSVGMQVQTFAKAESFLSHGQYEGPCCLVLDVRMPGLSGLDLQEELAKSGLTLPIIFITGHGTIPMSVKVMRAGAIDFLEKPFEDQALLDLIKHSLECDKKSKKENTQKHAIHERFKTLSPREQQVMALVVTGKANREVASEVGISERTVKAHRGQVMRKMEAESLADLVRMAEEVPLPKA